MSESVTFSSHSWRALHVIPCHGFQWSNISHLLSLLKIYTFEEFWYVFWIFQMQVILRIFDIRIWMILFSLPWQRSVIFSPLQIVLMVKKNEPLFFFLPLLYNTAVVLCCAPPTQCKVLLLVYYYYSCWVDCLETKCRFLMETDSLESIEFLCLKKKRECIDNLVTTRSFSKR